MAAPIRVLQITKSTGGVAEYVRWLVEGLDRERFQMTVVCLSENGREFAAELRQNYGASTFDFEMNRFSIDLFSDLRVFLQLRRVVRSGRYDLIHAHASKPGFLARLAAWGSGIPVIYSPHCFSFHQGVGKLQARFFALLERLAARFFTTKIMVVADGEKTLARQYQVGRPDQFVTVHHGIELRADQPQAASRLKHELGLDEAMPLVGAVGRFSPQKAPLDFVRMAGQVMKKCPEAHFVWVGSGPLEGETRALVHAEGLNDVFHFAGQRSDVLDLIPGLDCMVLPSLWEGFSIVLLEAMAARLPIVATDIPGNDEALRNGVDGWLVPPGDVNLMAEKVVSLLNDRELAGRFGAAAHARVAQDFNKSLMLEKVGALYTETIL